MAADKTNLSSTMTVAQYNVLADKGDRHELARFVRQRFEERYFRPINSTPATDKHGFTIMAVCCLLIETLESFYQGRADTKGKSRKMFSDFFERDTALKVFGGGNAWFYCDIRCGILHQSEARNGWHIVRSGPLIDHSKKRINATRFIRELRKSVDIYAQLIEDDDVVWSHFKKKMQAVCGNCT